MSDQRPEREAGNPHPTAAHGTSPSRRILAVALSVLFTGLIFVIGWTVLAACGMRTPFATISFSWCSAAAQPHPADSNREAILRDQIAQIERSLRHPDRCGQRVARLPDPPKDEEKPPIVAEKKAAPDESPCSSTNGGKPQPVNVYLLQDLTGSFGDDLRNFSVLISDMVKQIKSGKFGEDVRVGMGSFVDKPIFKFGRRNSYIFKNHLSLTSDVEQLVPLVRSLRVQSGGDVKEGQYEAIIEMVANAETIGFSQEARNFVVIITDAPPHVAGDWRPMPAGVKPRMRLLAPLYSPKPDDGRGDGNPIDEDYPAPEQVKRALNSINLSPIFLVSGRSIKVYQQFVAELGRGVTLPISKDSSNLMQALFTGLQKACKEDVKGAAVEPAR